MFFFEQTDKDNPKINALYVMRGRLEGQLNKQPL